MKKVLSKAITAHKSGASGGEVVDGFGAGDIVLDGAEAVFVVAGALLEFVEAVIGDLFGMGLSGLEIVDLEAQEVDGVFELLSDEFAFWVGGHLIQVKDCHARFTVPQSARPRKACGCFASLRDAPRDAPLCFAKIATSGWRMPSSR